MSEADYGLCNLTEGLPYSVADHYDAEFEVVERQCMHEGAEDCELLVRDVGAS